MPAFIRAGSLVLLLACACVTASATGYNFNVISGEWGNTQNWSPPGRPSCGDTVTIGNGRTCYITEQNECAGKITVEGTLSISGRTLTIYTDSGTETDVTVNGTIQLASNAVVHLNDDCQVAGSGQIVVTTGDTASITSPDYSTWLTVGSGVTIKGSCKFYTCIHNDGTFVVDRSEHEMDIGDPNITPTYRYWVEGSGTFRATAGDMIFGNTATGSGSSDALLRVNGGDVLFSVDTGTWHNYWDVKISAGTLTLDHSFCTRGDLEFSGGTVSHSA